MGYRCKDGKGSAESSYRALQVSLMKKNRAGAEEETDVVLTVHNDWDTLRFVKENMQQIAANVVRVKQMGTQRNEQVDENAELFTRNLEPLFTLISATTREHILDKLSLSLRKALLLMAMDRYGCDNDKICRALGLTRGKLEKELRRCGLASESREAA